MPYLFIAMIIGITAFLIIRAARKRSLPKNNYTPHDDIELGRPFDSKRDEPGSDTKHSIQYEEKRDD
ncbi:hypothetical protein [Domibacillus tundrae]|uniref:hypothetical protein n=1 Tax=Domibacillus tundrae TaxID=1587527 RepID=UPI0006181C32|nr:hypothetical protein [Domibacillus tundrae]